MNEVLQSECKSDGITKKEVKDIFIKIYTGQFEQVLKFGLDEKKQKDLYKAL